MNITQRPLKTTDRINKLEVELGSHSLVYLRGDYCHVLHVAQIEVDVERRHIAGTRIEHCVGNISDVNTYSQRSGTHAYF